MSFISFLSKVVYIYFLIRTEKDLTKNMCIHIIMNNFHSHKAVRQIMSVKYRLYLYYRGDIF